MRMAVEDDVWPMRPDGGCEPARSEERPDALGLADDRVDGRGVVEEDEAPLAAGDRLESGLERLDLATRLRVDLAQEALAEVGDLRPRKPADEALRADDADLHPGQLEHDVSAVEHDDTRALEHSADLVLEPAVVVVVAEHRCDGRPRALARRSEDAGLVDEPMRGQIAGEQDEVDVLQRGEGPLEMLAVLVRRMEVADGGDTQLAHGPGLPASVFHLPRPGYHGSMSYSFSEDFPELAETMKRAAAALREAGVPFLLGGGMAGWARGGPPTDHDVDFYLVERDAERGLAALADAGFRPERPPEGWLLKAWDGDVLVDLIFHPSGGPVDDGYFERADELEVVSQPLLVASIDDVLATKLLAMTEQEPHDGPVLELARALREQVDWDALHERVAEAPFGAAFLTLAERLEIAPPPVGSRSGRPGGPGPRKPAAVTGVESRPDG